MNPWATTLAVRAGILQRFDYKKEFFAKLAPVIREVLTRK
jgi:hypothetical protein